MNAQTTKQNHNGPTIVSRTTRAGTMVPEWWTELDILSLEIKEIIKIVKREEERATQLEIISRKAIAKAQDIQLKAVASREAALSAKTAAKRAREKALHAKKEWEDTEAKYQKVAAELSEL